MYARRHFFSVVTLTFDNQVNVNCWNHCDGSKIYNSKLATNVTTKKDHTYRHSYFRGFSFKTVFVQIEVHKNGHISFFLFKFSFITLKYFLDDITTHDFVY